MRSRPYLKALRFDALTPHYDTIIRRLLPEMEFKRCLAQAARIASSHRVLDLGCGTATLTIVLKTMHPQAEIVGMDPDPRILAIAREKIAKAGLDIALDPGMAGNLPYDDGSFDRVVSSLVLHHLSSEQKRRALREGFRVLKSGGELHVADWGRPPNRLIRAAFLIEQLVDGFENTSDNVRGRLPQLFLEAGFKDVRETRQFKARFAVISIYQGRKILT